MTATDNEPVVFYDQGIYQISNVIQILGYVVVASSLFVFVAGIFCGKLVGVEMMAVVQISYLSLLSLDQLNPSFRALSKIQFVNGYNYHYLSKGHLFDQLAPVQVKGMYMYSYFLQNYNLTVILVLLPLLMSLICLVLQKTFYKNDKPKKLKVKKVGRKLMK